MRLRKRTFIERLGWKLPQTETTEFEQYDSMGYCTYVLAHDGKDVQAGCRLIRCDSNIGNGNFTYMINDAYNGRIDLPSSICHGPPPTDSRHWELTRLAAEQGQRRSTIDVMKGAHDYLAYMGAVGCLCLGPPSVKRLAEVSGYRTEEIGPICGNKDGRFQVFRIPIVPYP